MKKIFKVLLAVSILCFLIRLWPIGIILLPISTIGYIITAIIQNTKERKELNQTKAYNNFNETILEAEQMVWNMRKEEKP